MRWRDHVGKVGGSLMGAAFVSAIGYLITSHAVGQPSRHLTWPLWPYYLCGAMFVLGILVYGEAHGLIAPTQPAARPADTIQVPRLSETSRSPWDRNEMPRGHIKGFRLRRTVGLLEWVKGKVSFPTRDAEPQLLVYSIVSGRFTPCELKIDGRGNFKARPAFEVSSGEECILLLVFTPRSINFYKVDELPEEVRILDQRRVVRSDKRDKF